ncbi:translation initiation factor IF-2 subunit beta [Candidatus Micrarchaeota archaeon]|nr:translation initiation factor IF-2 subunit beta [Candidatus Micrarchaeota archaeon]MBI5177311.1 translation initiation factor IF-2 subunit beta [Candidatus Micrarchaeota archaeon]
MDDYDSLLNDLYSKLPKKKTSGERFELPVADVAVVGAKTTIRNFDAICSHLRRDPKEVAKYLFKELAIPGAFEGNRLVLQGRVGPKPINDRIASYVKDRVLCKECGRPDTDLAQVERNVYALKCQACGAKSSVRA